MARRKAVEDKVTTGDIIDISGEVNIAAGDIIKNIKTIHQRALTAAEEATHARKLENRLLAQGIATLVQNLSAQASEGTESDSPYKGLLPYSLNEAEIFYGRDKARKDLLAHIKQSPLTVLHAESGAGKSSLLQAGIAAQLIANGDLAVYLRPYHADPVEFIKRMFLPELTQAPVLADAPLREFLRQVCTVLGPKVNLYLLLDQFEEFFQLKKEERQPFLESLADCLNDPSLKVRWVLALRKEALSDLAELESFGITQFKNTYRLDRLSRAEAQEAMVEPARRYGITFEPALTEHILDTLTTNDEIRPTHLQLVCSALTDDLPEEKTLTLEYYTEQEGGTEGILRDYLKRQLEDLPAGEQALSWKVLRALITADGQRAVKTNDQLIQELKTSGVTKKQIATILGRLVERRLLFTQTQPATEEVFELAHDYLIKEIELDPQEQALKAAQELLDQEARTYQRHKTLLTAELLAVIQPYHNELNFSAEAKALLSESQKAVQEEQRSRERRRNITLGISSAIAIAMTLLAIWGFRSSGEAKRQGNIALARQLVAQAQSIHGTRESTAILLAAQSLRLFPISGAAQIYQDSLLVTPIAGIAKDENVTSVAFSPDGKYLVSGGGTSARVWDVISGEEITHMTHDGDVTAVLFSPNGKYVLSQGGTSARVWEALSGKEVARIIHHDPFYSIAFSPDSKYVVTGSMDNSACVWEARTGKEVTCMIHNGPVYSVDFSPDSKHVVSAGFDGTVRVWWALTGKEVAHTHMTHDGFVDSVAFSPNGNYVVSGSVDGTARVWDPLTGQEIARRFHAGGVYSVAFSPDGNYVVSGSADDTAVVWRVQAGAEEVAHMTHYGDVFFVAFSPDGKYVMTGSDDHTAHVWKISTNREISQTIGSASATEVGRITYLGLVMAIAFSPDGKHVASVSSDGVSVWDAFPKNERARMVNNHHITTLSFSPDAQYVMTGSDDHTARVWKISTSEEKAHMMHDGSVTSVSFSPNRKYVVSTSQDDTARVWEALTGKEIARMTHDNVVNSAAFSPDGKYVVSGGDKTARVWEAMTGKEVARTTHDASVYSVAFSQDGKYAVSGSEDGIARVWEALTGKEVAHNTYDGSVTSVAFSPKGKYVVSGSEDGTARVWEALTGKEVARMTHDSGVTSVAFSPNGKYVVSGSEDGTARVWEAATGEEIIRMTHDDSVTSAVFSSDGQYVASGGSDGTARVWLYQPDTLRREACALVQRNLTPGEWTQYVRNARPYQRVCDDFPIEPEATPTLNVVP
jgi:WD40 repeat protein